MDNHALLSRYIAGHPTNIGKIVDYQPATDRLLKFDFTAANEQLSPGDIADTKKFSAWVDAKLANGNYRYGIGGYMENRTLYSRSPLFDNGDEARSLHLGVDIWAPAGTPVYAPLKGTVHSFQDNDHFGDYGPTIILEHQLNDFILYSLYGHLNRESLTGLYAGKTVSKNEQIAVFGDAEENGSWPPHLHFQLMFNMEGRQGDYPGVGLPAEEPKLRLNIPDPQMILEFAEI